MNSFLPFCRCLWVKNADARGTEAVKLSVKWLAGLAAIALAVVAVVGSTSSTKAAAGSIFVANEWSKLTNESPAPAGYTATGTVYATYDDGVRLIQTDSDLIKIVVKDAGADTLTTTTAAGAVVDVDDDNNGLDGGDDNTMTTPVGQQVTVFLNGLGSTPIAGPNSTIQILSGTTDLVANGTLTIVARFDGSAGNDPWIRVQRNTGSGTITIANVVYQTSALDQITGGITVKSDLEVTGVTIQADETGLSTGIFHGFIRIVSSTQTTTASTGAGSANAGSIRASVGPITVSFQDTDSVTRQSSVSIDVSSPTASVTGPVSGSSTQNERPTFSGSVSDAGSGLDISTVTVAYDNANDASNASAVVDVSNGNLSGTAATLGISTSGAVDGDLAFSFSQAPGSDIPNQPGTPNHIVDWVVKASDLAGNIGLSDSDASTTGIQLHTVKIDQTIPVYSTTPSDHKTGLALTGTGEVSSRKSIRIVFDDQVQNVQASDFVVTLDSGATVVPVAVTVDNNPTAFPNKGVVYLEFLNDLVSSETPVVALQDTIQDLAGNSTATGSVTITDGIKPKLTVTLLSGSGTGTGSEGPAQLTKEKITIRITSDEPLTAAPAVNVYPKGVTTSEASPTALSQGTNTWDAVYSRPGGAPAGDKAVVVSGTDAATNTETISDTDTKAFKLDVALANPVVKVGGSGASTSQVRPFITIDFADVSLAPNQEVSTVTVSEILLDDTDVTADLVSSSNGKKFFITPSSDLSQGEHTVKIVAKMAKDAAGNENASDISLTFTVTERVAFERTDIFAGWNGVSFPSDPVDPDLDAVFTNAGHDAVLVFDPSVPGLWRIATRDAVSGEFTTTSQNGLTSMRSTDAAWVHSNNFESIEVLLVGETLPGNSTPPPIVSIPTVPGFNAIPVVDSSRRLTSGPNGNLTRKDASGNDVTVTVSDYLGGAVEGRVMVWDPETLSFLEQASTSVVNTGTVLFVEIIPDSSGNTPPIFP
jgi:hypothetical protein